VQADNSAYENSLNNMYSLEDIYTIATNELGMVYSQNGQIVYYEQEQGDYVKQYSDVPATSD
ncbi:MAG: cell division protein FtsL, partial [Eubacterium sp.]|nr:cell division protein FtsL [Eubacterium sp.]